MLRPIVLNATMSNYSAFMSRKANKTFRDICKKVWTRDNYTCQFCGFQAQDYQEVVNVDQNYRNNKLDNLATSCCFCTQCSMLESLGEGGYGGGTLIYLPQMTQNELNSFCHVLFCAIVNNTAYKDSAQAIYRTFRARAKFIDDKFGEGVSEPAVFGQLLVDYKMNHRKQPPKILDSVRLLPARGRFEKQIKKWAEAAVAESSAT